MNRFLAPILLVVATALAAWNWYLQPERAAAWIAALLFLGVMAFVLRRTDRSGGSIPGAIAFAGVMLVIALSGKLGVSLGLIHDADYSRRAMNVIVGALLIFLGNGIPKRLTPHCRGERAQALQRLAGWTWVLAGFGYATAWLVMPIEVADPVTLVLILTAMVATLAPLLWRRA